MIQETIKLKLKNNDGLIFLAMVKQQHPPTPHGPFIYMFYHFMYKSLVTLCNATSYQRHRNCTSAERKDLDVKKNINPCQADRGGSLVIQDKNKYLKEAFLFLSDTTSRIPALQLEVKSLKLLKRL